MDWSVKYGGRGFRFIVVVNTDEDLRTLLGRIENAAKGEKFNATSVFATNVEPEEMKNIMEMMANLEVEYSKRTGS